MYLIEVAGRDTPTHRLFRATETHQRRPILAGDTFEILKVEYSVSPDNNSQVDQKVKTTLYVETFRPWKLKSR